MVETEKAIYFYSISDEKFSFLSNFYPCDFSDGVNSFSSTEQYFHFMKAKLFEPDNDRLHKSILNCADPKRVKRIGRRIRNFDNTIWDEAKVRIMLNGNIMKYSQNPELLNKLLATGDKTLYEASSRDRIWGIGFSPSVAYKTLVRRYGENLFGKVLMDTRKRISSTNTTKS